LLSWWLRARWRSWRGHASGGLLCGWGGGTSWCRAVSWERRRRSGARFWQFADGGDGLADHAVVGLGVVSGPANFVFDVGHRLEHELGDVGDVFSHSQSFSSYSNQAVARVAWLPIHSEAEGTLLHLGANFRYGTPENDQLQIRSRPEAFPGPYFVDTGKFEATATRMAGYEAYYRVGPWMLGSEYWFQLVSSRSTGNPVFRGGDIVTTWILTGETRPYNTVGGYFKAVTPSRPVFDGGPGAWELVLRFSSIDLNSGTLRGGKFWRFTPDLNWYLSAKYVGRSRMVTGSLIVSIFEATRNFFRRACNCSSKHRERA
jgi:Phosphate-selective porin O and P